MEKTAVLSDLPHGSGAALGAFIRSLFLTASNKYSIIGIGVNGQGAFDKIGNNTTLVTDIVLLFTSERYTISEKITEMARMCGSSSLGDVYELSISLNNASEIKNCLDDGMTVLIKKAKANNSTKDNEFRKDKFKYDPEKDVYICPAEQQLYFFENTSKNGMKYK